ncbi:MAG TPA: hypothetical protein VNH11_02965 [Pirellulales bacterium]|nr:hypothetical protein [Pirellulales bacterium]
MAKPKAAPDQLTFPGVELDSQDKFDFALPGGRRAARRADEDDESHLPPNLGQPVKLLVPDFSDPNRPKTCLEVDFPIVPINALSILEGNAGKPIYQMSKWWARRRSCVFRAMLIAAATQAPFRKHPDGSPVLDENGRPLPDDTEAAKAVWDVYYANHQAGGNFKHLKVLDCFMGGGTTLVEGSRLGFQVTGVDLNPVAWFVVKNELACTDPAEVKAFFASIEAEVKPLIQPFYVTDCPRGHKGTWFDVATGKPVEEDGLGESLLCRERPPWRSASPAAASSPTPRNATPRNATEGVPYRETEEALGRPSSQRFDPATLPPEERKRYRYEGPEIIYTFWAKHGPCTKPGCGHRTPVFRSPVIAEKKLGVKYIPLTCKSCKTRFHAELGSARMAPAAERVVLDSEEPFTELSQPFARLLAEYGQGNKDDKRARAAELFGMVESEPGLRCPKCGAFAGQYLRDVLNNHRQAQTAKAIDKKDLKIEPARNSTKPVYCYLLIHPDWLQGSPGTLDGEEVGGYADAPVEATARWYRERLKNLSLIEVRGRIRLADDSSLRDATDAVEAAEADETAESDVEPEAEDRKTYGLPRFITLADGRKIDTRKTTFIRKATIACQSCGQPDGIIEALRRAKHSAPLAPYALQCFCPQCKAEGHVYDGRYFTAPTKDDTHRLTAAMNEWDGEKNGVLAPYWPTDEIPYGWQTHYWSIGDHGYTHWYRFFNPRQLLTHASLLRSIARNPNAPSAVRDQALGALEQYLRNQNMYCIWDVSRDCMAPFYSNNHFVPKHLVVENSVFPMLGRGNWQSCTEKVIEGLAWANQPWEPYLATSDGSSVSGKVEPGDAVRPGGATITCGSSSDMPAIAGRSVDLVITDPPFGDNFIYSEMANFFYAWLRLGLKERRPDVFAPAASPFAQEAVKNVAHHHADADQFYKTMMTACWAECVRVLKDAGLLAFTFHHSEDSQWVIVLESLFDAGLILEATIPIASDESKGEGAAFGSKKIEYDIIHVCRKRLAEPTKVSWAKMRQWVKAELKRLRRLLEAYKASELSEADIRVILRGKALEFYSRHYGQVYTAEDEAMSIERALLGINQLLDEDTGGPGERPPSIVSPLAYQFLRLFGSRAALPRDELGKNLRGTGIVQREFEDLGWIQEEAKTVYRVPIAERFEKLRQRPRKEMKTEIDQAHFLIGAALAGSGMNLENEFAKNTWIVRRTVEAVLVWYSQTAVEPEIREAATLAATLLRRSIEERRTQLRDEQGVLFDEADLD